MRGMDQIIIKNEARMPDARAVDCVVGIVANYLPKNPIERVGFRHGVVVTNPLYAVHVYVYRTKTSTVFKVFKPQKDEATQ